MKQRYFAKEFARNRYHICDRECFSLPIYRGIPGENDKPIIFKDEDDALECAERLNIEEDERNSEQEIE